MRNPALSLLCAVFKRVEEVLKGSQLPTRHMFYFVFGVIASLLKFKNNANATIELSKF